MNQRIEDYIEYLLREKRASNNTVMCYRRDLGGLREFLDTQLSISDWNMVTETNLNSYLLSLKNKGRAETTISRNVVSIKGFFTYLLRRGAVKNDASEFIIPPRVTTKVKRETNDSGVSALVNQEFPKSNKGIRDEAMLKLLCGSGIKITELIELTVDDVNLNTGVVIIRSANGLREKAVLVERKALEVLKLYVESVRSEICKSEAERSLFLNLRGRAITRQGVWLIIKEYANLAGVANELTPYTLTHAFQ